MPQLPIPMPTHFSGSPTDVLLSFSGVQGLCPTLRIRVDRYNAPHQNGGIISLNGISPDQEDRLENQMLEWASTQTRFEGRTDFKSYVEQTLSDFASKDILQRIAAAETPSDAVQVAIVKQQEVMDNIIKMSAMWKIWSARELFVRRPGLEEYMAFPIRTELESVQAHLRLCAGTILSRLEGEVLRGINRYLAPQQTRKTETPRLWAAMNVAMWLSLMQLILLYREAENTILMQHQTHPLIVDIGGKLSRSRLAGGYIK